jgi:hypothetical protein
VSRRFTCPPRKRVRCGAVCAGGLVLAAALALSCAGAALADTSFVLPGAIEPLPVNKQIEEEFWAKVAEWQGRGKLAVQAPQPWSVQLEPGLEGGWVGWCVTVSTSARHTRCPVDPAAADEIGYESWEAGGSGTVGLAIVGESTEAISVDEADRAEPTMPVAGVPGAAAALVEIPATFPARSGWFDEFSSVQHGLRNSGSRGWGGPQRNYSKALPASSWQGPEAPPAGVCSLTVARLAALRPRFGHVVTSLAPTPSVAGGGYASCIDTEYSFAHSSLDAAVLLDAAAPGQAAPVALPGEAAVRHHPGLYSAPGWNGPLLGRRVGNAWLVVEGGAKLKQRIAVLSHLHAHVNA